MRRKDPRRKLLEDFKRDRAREGWTYSSEAVLDLLPQERYYQCFNCQRRLQPGDEVLGYMFEHRGFGMTIYHTLCVDPEPCMFRASVRSEGG